VLVQVEVPPERSALLITPIVLGSDVLILLKANLTGVVAVESVELFAFNPLDGMVFGYMIFRSGFYAEVAVSSNLT